VNQKYCLSLRRLQNISFLYLYIYADVHLTQLTYQWSGRNQYIIILLFWISHNLHPGCNSSAGKSNAIQEVSFCFLATVFYPVVTGMVDKIGNTTSNVCSINFKALSCGVNFQFFPLSFLGKGISQCVFVSKTKRPRPWLIFASTTLPHFFFLY